MEPSASSPATSLPACLPRYARRRQARRKQPKTPKGNALEQSEEKKKNKARIMELVVLRGEIRNNDGEKILGVSDASAERYLNELEREGKLVQKGDSGRGVFYRRP